MLKKNNGSSKPLWVRLDDPQTLRVDTLARAMNKSRAAMLKYLIEIGLSTMPGAAVAAAATTPHPTEH